MIISITALSNVIVRKIYSYIEKTPLQGDVLSMVSHENISWNQLLSELRELRSIFTPNKGLAYV